MSDIQIVRAEDSRVGDLEAADSRLVGESVVNSRPLIVSNRASRQGRWIASESIIAVDPKWRWMSSMASLVRATWHRPISADSWFTDVLFSQVWGSQGGRHRPGVQPGV
jgi:hypothetical protein